MQFPDVQDLRIAVKELYLSYVGCAILELTRSGTFKYLYLASVTNNGGVK